MTEHTPSDKIVVRNLYKIFGPEPEQALALSREGLSKDEIFERTGNTIGVNDASFTIREGEIFVVMGLSGSGKSTLVRMLNRLIDITAGQVLVDGRDVASLSTKELIAMRRMDMSMVFQSFALMPHQTVAENAAFGLEVAGVPKKEQEERALNALEAVGLKAWAKSLPAELSGGMKQRVGLARALASNPTILLMDEAFSALDPLIRTEMQDELLRLQDEKPRTVVFISHDLDEAFRIGDRIAIMEGGRVVQIATPEDIVRNPANDYVRSFFRGVDVSQVLHAKDVARRDALTVIERPGMAVEAAMALLDRHDRDEAVVIGRNRRYQGMVTVETLMRLRKVDGKTGVEGAFLPDVEPLLADTPLEEVVARISQTELPLPVVDESGKYLGVVTHTALLRILDRTSDLGESNPVEEEGSPTGGGADEGKRSPEDTKPTPAA